MATPLKWDELSNSPPVPKWDDLSDSPPADTLGEQQLPQEQYANAQQAQQRAQQANFVPEMVAGSQRQMDEQRARNLQGSMGLSEPMAPSPVPYADERQNDGFTPSSAEYLRPQSAGVSFFDRIVAGFAPTAEEQKAYYELEYGKGSFIPVSKDRALVRVPTGKKDGSRHWVVDDPVGLDAGDVAQLSSNVPQIINGAIAASAAVPNATSPLAKIAVASGASAIVSGITGAIQDSAYRLYAGTPVNMDEIIQRRGLGAAMETVAGIVLPVVGGKIVQQYKSGRAVKALLDEYSTTTRNAKEALGASGVNPKTAGELGDALRALSPEDANAAELGDSIAALLNKNDDAIRKGTERMSGQALSNAEARAQAQIANATQAVPIQSKDAGLAAIGAAKKVVIDNQKAVDDLYKSAYKEIGNAVNKTGAGGKNFVNLFETNNAIEEISSKNLLIPDGSGGFKKSDVFAPLASKLKQIDEATYVPQSLEAARQLRTMIGDRAYGRGGSDIFSSLDEAAAKRIYNALSKDIDDSISAFSGSGALALKKANDGYKVLISSVDESKFIGKLVNNGFNNPEEVVRSLVGGGTKDWADARSVLPPNTYAAVRRAVVGELSGEGQGSKLVQFGREVLDVPTLSKNLKEIDIDVKNEIFGSEAPWKALQKIGDEYSFITKRGGMFTTPALPLITDIKDAVNIAKTQGFDAANQYIKKMVAGASARRNSLGESLISQINNGTMSQTVQNPDNFLRAVIFNNEIRPSAIRSVLRKLPERTRTDIGNTAYQEIFENARQQSESLMKRGGSYDIEKVVNQLFGDRKRMEVITDTIGEKRMEILTNWARFEVGSALEAGSKTVSGRRFAGLIATAPYQNLFAARATSMALETAAGSSLISSLTKKNAALFAETRQIIDSPRKTAYQISLLQRALNTNGFSDYQEMLSGFTMQQKDAIDGYLNQ
jgi:hypothetical protein